MLETVKSMEAGKLAIAGMQRSTRSHDTNFQNSQKCKKKSIKNSQNIKKYENCDSFHCIVNWCIVYIHIPQVHHSILRLILRD